MGATIMGTRVYCPTCAEKMDEMFADLESKLLEAVILKNEKLPDLDKLLSKYDKTIKELKLSPAIVKRRVLGSVVGSLQLGRGHS